MTKIDGEKNSNTTEVFRFILYQRVKDFTKDILTIKKRSLQTILSGRFGRPQTTHTHISKPSLNTHTL